MSLSIQKQKKTLWSYSHFNSVKKFPCVNDYAYCHSILKGIFHCFIICLWKIFACSVHYCRRHLPKTPFLFELISRCCYHPMKPPRFRQTVATFVKQRKHFGLTDDEYRSLTTRIHFCGWGVFPFLWIYNFLQVIVLFLYFLDCMLYYLLLYGLKVLQ